MRRGWVEKLPDNRLDGADRGGRLHLADKGCELRNRSGHLRLPGIEQVFNICDRDRLKNAIGLKIKF